MDFDAIQKATEPMRRMLEESQRRADMFKGPVTHVFALQEAQEEQRRSIEEAAAQIAEANRLNAERQAERDELQRENVRLLHEAAEREHARDEQAKASTEAERTRKRRELYRWVFTTAIALAGITIAIIGLVTR